ncbi:12982_t:CDS:10 [Entrophospora sp. SA101]|nr:12982_t:CDS:10 [Entrophospora sp. SA101]
MRDKEGNALRSAHILGFFRRICKLLFFNIKPVFVFDGGAPEIKRHTLMERKKRRVGIENDLQKTAQKILAAQIRIHAIEEAGTSKSKANKKKNQSLITDDMNDELRLSAEDIFKHGKKDEYDLPPITGGIETMIAKDDPRFTTNEDLNNFIEEFKTDGIDIDSELFRSLSTETQYEIIGELRLKSRLEANSVRIASERNKKYVLIKNDDDSMGWRMEKPVKLDENSSESDYEEVIHSNNKKLNEDGDDWEEFVINDSSLKADVGQDNEIADYPQKRNLKNDNNYNKNNDDVIVDDLIKDVDSFYAMWLSCMSNEFQQEFDDHNDLIYKAIYEWNESDLKDQLNTISKKLGKTKEGDALKVKKSIDDSFELDSSDFVAKRESPSRSSPKDELEITDNDIVESIKFSDPVINNNQQSINNEMLGSDEDDEHYHKSHNDCNDLNVVYISNDEGSNDFKDDVKDMSSNRVDKELGIKTSFEGDEVSSEIPGTEEVDFSNQISDKEEGNEDVVITTVIDSIEEDEGGKIVEENNEFARFLSELKDRDLSSIQQELSKEIEQLNEKQRREKRDADNITQSMITECQKLLQLFGIPFIVAPMEAEAQCAELLTLGLVDGIITDDSDVFLFGGSKVYKNMFNQQKYVERYDLEEVEREMQINRNKLIQLSILLGSDYTEGLTGIGIVNAIEILNEFPGEDGLEKFRDWWNDVQSGRYKLDKQIDSDFKKKFVVNKNFFSKCQKFKSLILNENFPNRHIWDAYLHPQVDDSTEEFQWGIPDIDLLQE